MELLECKACRGSGKVLYDSETGEMTKCSECLGLGHHFPPGYMSYEEDEVFVKDSGMKRDHKDERYW